jgi:hypothetical protein
LDVHSFPTRRSSDLPGSERTRKALAFTTPVDPSTGRDSATAHKAAIITDTTALTFDLFFINVSPKARFFTDKLYPTM